MKKVLAIFLLLFFTFGCEKEKVENEPMLDQLTPMQKEITIIDKDSKTRPYALVINNSTVATKVQTGLDKAYMIYEFPVEGGLTRLMALYKDVEDITIGTLRSARHNFLDYVFEHDAIFVCFGWSHYAEDDMKSIGINYINGVVHSGPFWRDNPENLAVEHTAYTSMNKLKDFANSKSYSKTTENDLVLNYSEEEIDLSKMESHQIANNISIPAGGETTTYQYEKETGLYKRMVNGTDNVDYKTKAQYKTKNIIVQKINTKMANDNYYWDLETIGAGGGYFITNGYAIPIKWSKTSRTEKTKYTYLNGEEVVLNDGQTYIQLQSTKQKLTIE